MTTNTDPWAFLQSHTPARIAQGRTGHSLPTQALLAFQLDHARARDAVFATLEISSLLEQLEAVLPNPLLLNSQATDRKTYLQRPDLGRQLSDESRQQIKDLGRLSPVLSIVLADGLSATAVNSHAMAVVAGVVSEAKRLGWSLGPIAVVQQGRVAVADEVAHFLGAEMVLMLIGERPGLSSPSSLGAYLTYNPQPGLTDEARNCISNIRPEGLTTEWAVQKIIYLLTQFKVKQLSGVQIKDEMSFSLPSEEIPPDSTSSLLNS
jgi:ethanolamine ammonia-lyase small subunit